MVEVPPVNSVEVRANMNDTASALASLSTRYVNEQFNPDTPDVAGVNY